LSGKLEGKTIGILVAQEFEDIELLYPILQLSEEGANILVAAVRTGFDPPGPISKISRSPVVLGTQFLYWSCQREDAIQCGRGIP